MKASNEVRESIKLPGRLLARNTALNFIGHLVPLAIGVITIPFIIRGLGIDAFGILTIASVVMGHFSLFDLGLGRATTQLVAKYLGRGEREQIPQLAWTSLLFHLILGILGGALLAALTPLLVEWVLNIPPALVGEARQTFFILSTSVPVVLLGAALRGMLEGAQRFDLVNIVKLPTSAAMFIIPVIVLPLGMRLPGIVFLLLLARFGAGLAYLILNLRVFGDLKSACSFDIRMAHVLLTFGGWVTVSNVVGPILVYLDRFLVGSLISMAAVAYYTAPYELVTRLWILPWSLVPVLFSAFSSLGATGNQERLEWFYGRSVKFLLLTTGPLVLLLILFADSVLYIWLGEDFSQMSTLVLQILAVGIFVSSLAHVPYGLLQGLGRPDITAKFHLIELPFYVALAWVLVTNMGITGASLVWTLRVVADAVLLFGASWKLYGLSPRVLIENGFSRGITLLVVFAAAVSLLTLWPLGLILQAAIAAFLVASFAWAAWRYALDPSDKELFHRNPSVSGGRIVA